MPYAGQAMNNGKSQTEASSREAAIKRRLDKENKTSELGAKVKSSKMSPKGGSFTPTKYQEKYIKGSNEGFTKSDYGAAQGAAIPYQIGSRTKTYTGQKKGTSSRPNMPSNKPSKRSAGKVKSYKVKRGDTLSGIAQKNNTTWKDIWDYNLKNRNPSTVKTLKKRGPNLIYRGSTFYIP